MDRRLIVIAGIVLGVLGVVLVRFGNPANMGVCVACFIRDVSGGLGLHRAAVVQYLRPEVSGFVIGSFLLAAFSGEFRSRGGSSPMLRFLLGFSVMIGALVFLGCPLRMLLRLAAGDLNALVGLFGFVAGIVGGVYFLRRGFSLGRSTNIVHGNGLSLPLLALALLVLVVAAPAFVFFSESGPGSFRAPFMISLGAGILIGIVVQRSRLCQAGCFRDLILVRDPHLLYGSLAIFGAALVFNVGFGYFNLGFAGQPVAHTDGLWNFLGLAVVGMGSTLLGGCPLRQTVMAGEGDADAGMAFFGLLAGAAFAHNFGLASSAAGATLNGKWAVMLVFAFMISVGFTAVLPKVKISIKGAVTHDG